MNAITNIAMYKMASEITKIGVSVIMTSLYDCLFVYLFGRLLVCKYVCVCVVMRACMCEHDNMT